MSLIAPTTIWYENGVLYGSGASTHVNSGTGESYSVSDEYGYKIEIKPFGSSTWNNYHIGQTGQLAYTINIAVGSDIRVLRYVLITSYDYDTQSSYYSYSTPSPTITLEVPKPIAPKITHNKASNSLTIENGRNHIKYEVYKSVSPNWVKITDIVTTNANHTLSLSGLITETCDLMVRGVDPLNRPSVDSNILQVIYGTQILTYTYAVEVYTLGLLNIFINGQIERIPIKDFLDSPAKVFISNQIAFLPLVDANDPNASSQKVFINGTKKAFEKI